MNSAELAKKIRRIEIKSNKLVDEIFSGEYHSTFRGKGMELDSIRQYVPGDEIQSIDWNVTARHNEVFVKQFREERELNIFLLIDMSRSNHFGKKRELIAEISATLAFSSIINNDKVGAVFFTGTAEKYIPSRNGKRHVLSLIEHILKYEPLRADTDVAGVLRYFDRIEKKRSVVFMISDFLDEGFEKEMAAMSIKHDLIRICVTDRAEEHIPAGAIFTFEDLETGERRVLDNLKRGFFANRPGLLSRRNLITVYPGEDYVKPLTQFFRRRGVR